MPASRWISNVIDLYSLTEQEDEALEDLLNSPIVPHIVQTDEKGSEEILSDEEAATRIPSVLPILPLRGLVVYPQTAVPLTIGQPRSIRLVDDVVAGETRLVGLIASRDPDLETPEPKDLFAVGTVAMVHRLFRAPDNTIRLVVQGLARFRTNEYIQLEPYLKANIELIPERVEEGSELEALARSARTQFERIAELIPSIPRELVASILALEDSLQTVYTIANFQRMELEDAQAILELDSASEKLHKLVGILAHELEARDILMRTADTCGIGVACVVEAAFEGSGVG